jgi:hypothetical protein
MQTWTGVAGTKPSGGNPAIPTTTLLTPLNDPTITQKTATSVVTGFLDQKIAQNTVLATANLMPEFKLSGGFRYKIREINNPHATALTWRETGLLLGAVMQPNSMLRINFNFDAMNSVYASGTSVLGQPATPLTLGTANTFTRVAPNRSYNVRARATIKPAQWINLALSGRDYEGENDDPQINHLEHSREGSAALLLMPMEGLSIDLDYAYASVYSKTSLCYVFTPNPNAPLPPGAANSGTCVNSPTNPEGAPNLYLGTGLYDMPSHYYGGVINYSPKKLFHISAGARMNDTNGTAEELNPLMVPGALRSHYVTPFGDAEYRLTPQWAWHGNFTRTQYTEQGPVGTTAPRNTSGNVLTLGVKYEY